MNLKKQYGWSLLIIAHIPRRSLTSPITQNDLAGSKKLYEIVKPYGYVGPPGKVCALLLIIGAGVAPLRVAMC